MNYKLPILSVVLASALPLWMVFGLGQQVLVSKQVALAGGAREDPSPAATQDVSRDGQKLVAQAAQRLLVAPGIEAKTRQTVQLFDQKLVGSGHYYQLTNGPKLYLQWEMKLPVGDQVTSLRQICDGDVFWEVRDLGETKSVSYVNLLTLRSAASRTTPTVPPSLWMALGGLPSLLTHLDEHFQFQAPQPQTIAGLPVWSLQGEWKPSVLAQMLPEQKDAILAGQPVRWQDLPPQVPHGVTLILGRDNIIPLFPYSFSFFRFVLAQEDDPSPQRQQPILTWELFEVRQRPDLQPSYFDFRPSHQDIVDRTGQYLARLQEAAQQIRQ